MLAFPHVLGPVSDVLLVVSPERPGALARPGWPSAVDASVRAALVLALDPAAAAELDERGALSVVLDDRRITFNEVGLGVRRALRLLADGGATEEEFTSALLREDGPLALPEWYHALGVLEDLGAISYSLRVGTELVARLRPMHARLRPALPAQPADARLTLSRFAVWRREGTCLVIESPTSFARVELLDSRAVRAAAAFSRPTSTNDVREVAGDLPAWALQALVSLLMGAGMLTLVGATGDAAEDQDPQLLQWEPVDLLFHTRSRLGRHRNPVGGTYRFRGRIPPAAAAKSAMSERFIALHRPDLRALGIRDAPFSAVLEARRSLRSYGAAPVTAAQLGEFLYRVGRVQHHLGTGTGAAYAASLRPYPSGGACHGLELYPVVSACQGLEPGLYHYDPVGHGLEALPAAQRDCGRLLEDARRATGSDQVPQILIVIAARFARVTWKYQSVAYALILKEVGALYQTMYLVATAMRLAPCALGAGDAELFADAIGSVAHAESSVGEFALGSRASGEADEVGRWRHLEATGR